MATEENATPSGSGTVTVTSVRTDNRVAFFEKDQAHPDGEAFVRGNGKPVEAGDTPGLRQAIRQGKIKEVANQATPTNKQTPATKPGVPWPGYDTLSAEQVVARLRTMDPIERDKALTYERANKNRSTITNVQWNS